MSIQCFYKLGVIAYFNLNRDYISEVLCINKKEPLQACHGQCFLKTNLSLAEESTSKSAEVPITKHQVEFPAFVISELPFKFNNVFTIIERYSHYRFFTSLGYTRIPFRPPAFLS
jgi:hypothetical protein